MTFEEWYAGYNPANKSDKERAKDAWEAAAKGLDHSVVPDARLVAAAPQPPADHLRGATKMMRADDAASTAVAQAAGDAA